ncbi:TetR/AcrR family transcriptional regulator [Subtercola sp. RTI3]|uniref:TetR/AcrR family transcriptional regulator n=1 Tax=Subtercola sp. RTI3 TaxID=3048639 RepID=UPI002B23CC52|nr:TetR/AcrR family transcriptional regulator [Subtercola sp. RTI3]MEA9985887.1 TetR/AcrR family transcriptional regulator [Subtercola sp. RTI3]
METQVEQKANRPRAKTATERQRHPTEIRRQLVINAARDLIADKGLFNVLIRDISGASGVSPGTITYHFKGLDEVLMEVVKSETTDFYEPLQRSAREAPDPVSALTLLLGGLFRTDTDTRRHWLIWFDFWSAAARDDEYGRWMNDHYAGWRHALQEIVENGVASEAFVCDDPQAFASETAAIVDGLAVQCYCRESGLTVETAREVLLNFVRGRLGLAG